MSDIQFDEQDDEWWTCTSFQINPSRPQVRLTLTSDDEPSREYIERVFYTLAKVDMLILKASERILENYSYEHFLKLGVSESLLLKDESAEAMSKVVTLVSVCFMDQSCEEFELSFSVPWDDDHSFDVEFLGGDAICCAVNG